ncbi:aldehyde dehydrogenase family protein [Burkholderia pseudomultivorans]|uniref:aldehyde dehydrogenase (NAD(+)) n=1 Tax=Burkholderia pseudomultivorans TaxID=1207504 RepID=A0ABU2DWG9_9BURK|nr:aldehyde dehydrogenase family protein [Burkholderia pseudomultivorans]MDR8727194.1 putative aldehyde dehydrogenase [Burkholderia pseudomultivorans]MDR8734894.1 putative aldehyde dehydrogenase [Burkholderia pseudomultivorans]MDR8740837.1 putative aldehyde dehydrogenase [Burkholderia pseudomultivorans]MDR8751925.1 putative aldehyde dehydrogenase [Burkholderia pseudomultivorans]MDR8777251.1 putative aldehyde dehydrogenase [Burkholderia pseudomultivorans]
MERIEHIYIDGAFVTPHGREWFDLYNPSTEQVIGQVRLGDEQDVERAIAAAKAAFPGWSRTTREERIAALTRMHEAVVAREDDLMQAIVTEYGAPSVRCRWMATYPADAILQAIAALESFAFEEQAGTARVIMTPVGVAGLITPWNSNAGFICNKLATALAAGCTAVVKPSEVSAMQTQIVAEALHAAGLPDGVFNIVNGRGDVVGEALSRSPDIAKISFTGSSAVGEHLVRAGAATMKRVTLELGGKSPTVVLDDADFARIMPLVLQAGFANSGQACIAGTRVLVPRSRLDEFEGIAKEAVSRIVCGDPRNADTDIGPMVSARQWERVQNYIRIGQEEGATLLAGGEGRPEGVQAGWFVKPTLFSRADNGMRIAQEEIFGPVLTIIPYDDDADAIAIANDTRYGLSAVVLGQDPERCERVALQIDAGRVLVNTLAHEPRAPFGGFKHSGLGREMGRWGMSAYLEPKTLLGAGASRGE